MGIYNSLGHDLVSSSMQDIYLKGTTSYLPPSEVEIYETFLTNTPAAEQDDFRELYLCLHGRPIPGYVSVGGPKSGIECPTDLQAGPTPIPPQTEGTVAGDRAALVALYHATTGANWTNDSNWLSDAPLDEWFGVTTNNDGRVVAIKLRENRVRGNLPDALGALAGLKALDFGNGSFHCNRDGCMPTSDTPNQITGPIPNTFSNLKRLENLTLTANQMTGSLPTWLGELPRMEVLSLSANRFTGPIPEELGQLRSLRSLHLQFNMLGVQPFPTWIKGLQGLTSLGLSDSGLTGALPSWLGELTLLRTLDMTYNQLTGPIPTELANLTGLRTLRLGDNQLTGSLPASLGDLAGLRQVSVRNNRLTGSIPMELENPAELRILHISGNEFTGCMPPSLRGVENNDLDRLDLPLC